jgi:peroxiredoxin
MSPIDITRFHLPSMRRLAPVVLALALGGGTSLPAKARPELLKAGAQAPEFSIDAAGGGTMQLSSQLGKVVVLDFWATWCPPCQKSLPHLESVARAVAGQNVVVLGLCVMDDRANFDAWMQKNRANFSFKFAFDPAGRNPGPTLASRYFVNGIPTTYIIDPKGRVAETIVGFSPGDTRVEAALRKLGVKI